MSIQELIIVSFRLFGNINLNKEDRYMKSKLALIIGSFSIAALVSSGAVFAQAQKTQRDETTRPDGSGRGTSVGGSQSERSGESGTPLPKGSPYSGTEKTGTSKSGSSDAAATGMSGGNAKVKEAQQALKEKGHNPGPVDGILGEKTKEALKSFQIASNLQPTGTLNAETAQRLGVESDSSRSPGASRSSGSRSGSGSSDMPAEKRSDQPNQPSSRNR